MSLFIQFTQKTIDWLNISIHVLFNCPLNSFSVITQTSLDALSISIHVLLNSHCITERVHVRVL